ncbi:MAG: hypothetical protein K2G58_03820, partial [Alistipes sp.]|nr:hypothetical protein [Alistipes sp.]
VQHISFGYVKAGDEAATAVLIACGITLTAKYAPQGYTSEDSAEIYIYGKDIVSGSYALIETDKLPADLNSYMTKNGKAFTDTQLEDINTIGFSAVVGNLVGGTEYTLAVKAFNGYVSKLVTATATTEGTPHPLTRTYTASDLSQIGGGKAELFKTWNYYAKCTNEAGDALVTKREYLGQVAFKENTADDDPDEELDAIDVTGMTAHAAKALKFDDTMTFMYENGFVYTLGNQKFDASFQNMPLGILYLFGGMRVYPDISLDVALVGGLVEEGYLAFVSYPAYTSQGVDFNGLALEVFADNTYATPKGYLELYSDIMLVDPAVDDTTPAETASKTVSLKSLRNLAANAATPNNLVELRGRERMRALIDEMKANKSVSNAARTIEPVEMPALGA